MTESTKCPICSKQGIPNFHKEDVVCPCCGSDLSVYHKIYSLSSIKIPKKKKGILLSFFCVMALIIAGICGYSLYNNAKTSSIISRDLRNTIDVLNDSIDKLNKELPPIEIDNPNNQLPATDIYIVRKGDSFCRISKRLFKTEARYNEIVELNNLKKTSLLYEGDTLKVPKNNGNNLLD